MEMKQKQLEQGYVDRSGNSQQGFWQVYIKSGARVMRHDNSIDSARRVVDNIIICSKPIYIQIQDEVHAGKGLAETAAGQAIKTDLEKAAEKTKEELSSLKVEMQDALKGAKEDKDRLEQQYKDQMLALKQRMTAESEEERKQTQQQLANLKRQMENTLQEEMAAKNTLKQQFDEEISLTQQRLRAEYEEQKRLIEADNQKLRDDIASRRDGC